VLGQTLLRTLCAPRHAQATYCLSALLLFSYACPRM